MTAKPKMALLWNASTHTYQGIQEYGGEWFIGTDLGIDYARAKQYVAEWNEGRDV